MESFSDQLTHETRASWSASSISSWLLETGHKAVSYVLSRRIRPCQLLSVTPETNTTYMYKTFVHDQMVVANS